MTLAITPTLMPSAANIWMRSPTLLRPGGPCHGGYQLTPDQLTAPGRWLCFC